MGATKAETKKYSKTTPIEEVSLATTPDKDEGFNEKAEVILTTAEKLLEAKKQEGLKEEEKDFQKFLKDAKLGIDDVFPDQVSTFIQTKPDGYTVELCPRGDISTLKGAAKARKSFAGNVFMSALLSEDFVLGQFKTNLPKGSERVIYFDTEQSKRDVNLAHRAIRQQLGVEPTNLDVYSLKRYNPAQRIKYLQEIIKRTPNLGFVFIDGVRDLVLSINSEDETSIVMGVLMTLVDVYNIHIMCVIHTNKNDNNARGHLGGELKNKSSTVFEVAVDQYNDNISTVKAEVSRRFPMEDFSFKVENDIPVLSDKTSVGAPLKVLSMDKKREILRLMFSGRDTIKGKELLTSEFQRCHLLLVTEDFSDKAKSIGVVKTNEALAELMVKDLLKEGQNTYVLPEPEDLEPF
jgi:hypothetical protein